MRGKRHRVCSWAAPSGEEQDSDGNYSSSGVCCERLAKISAKKRINVTGRERGGEGGRESEKEREWLAYFLVG